MASDVKYFEVTSQNTKFVYHASIYDGDVIGRIYFGNRKCMMMTVYKNWKSDPDSYYAHLDCPTTVFVLWTENCQKVLEQKTCFKLASRFFFHAIRG